MSKPSNDDSTTARIKQSVDQDMTSMSFHVPPEPSVSKIALLLIFLVPSLGGMLYGYDIGATSFVISMMKDDPTKFAGDGGEDPPLSSSYWWTIVESSSTVEGLVVAAASLGALIGTIIVFPLADLLGRRLEIQISALLFLIGTTFNVLSGTVLKDSPAGVGVAIIIFGRLVYGIGIGFVMHGAPTYMSEMTPPSIRGVVVTAKESCIALGMVLGYGIGYTFSNNASNWPYLYGISYCITIPMLLMSMTIPRSVRWLLLRGKTEEALESLKFLFKGDGIQEEFEVMQREVREEMEVRQDVQSIAGTISSAGKRALIVGLGLVTLQQTTGQPSIISYVTVIFESVGLDKRSSVLISLFMLLSTLTTVLTIEKFGRKKLLWAGCSMMLVALTILTFAFREDEVSSSRSNKSDGGSTMFHKVIILVALFIYIGGYEIGFGPVTWLVASEVFPLKMRGWAMAACVQLNFAINFVVQFGVPVLRDAFGYSVTFGIFGIIVMYSLLFIGRYVPETKGMTLEEIQSLMTQQARDSDESEAEALSLLASA